MGSVEFITQIAILKGTCCNCKIKWLGWWDGGARAAPESGPRIIETTMISLHFHGLDGVVKGAGGPRIIQQTQVSLFFMVWAAW